MKKSIAIIDDDAIFQMLIEDIINTHKLAGKVLPFTDSEAALDFIKDTSIDECDLPDLILLDINMPIMDGWDFLEEFKEVKTGLKKEIDIYMLSSSISERDKTKAKNNPNVKGYLTKPISPDILKPLVQKYPGKGSSLQD